MVCCLTAPSHYLLQCWRFISEAQWHSHNYTASVQGAIRCNECEKYTFELIAISPSGQWVKCRQNHAAYVGSMAPCCWWMYSLHYAKRDKWIPGTKVRQEEAVDQLVTLLMLLLLSWSRYKQRRVSEQGLLITRVMYEISIQENWQQKATLSSSQGSSLKSLWINEVVSVKAWNWYIGLEMSHKSIV